MGDTVAAVMRHVKNYFERGCIEGEITIRGSAVSPVLPSPWVYISGSLYHDGAYMLQGDNILCGDLPSETFTGKVWQLHPPDDFIALCESIDAFCKQNPAGALTSERLNEYSYTRATGKHGVLTWQEAFADQLNAYRHMFTEVG